LIVPCVKLDSPGSVNDGLYFDVKLKQRGKGLNFELEFAEIEEAEVCGALIAASLAADGDTSDIEGIAGTTDDSSDDSIGK